MDLEDIGDETPGEISYGIAVARGWLNAILDGNGKFSSESILLLNEWHSWMGDALSAWEREEPQPSHPASWGSAKSTSSPAKPTSSASTTAATAAAQHQAAEAAAAELETTRAVAP